MYSNFLNFIIAFLVSTKSIKMNESFFLVSTEIITCIMSASFPPNILLETDTTVIYYFMCYKHNTKKEHIKISSSKIYIRTYFFFDFCKFSFLLAQFFIALIILYSIALQINALF